jgi:hypothetical protein
MARSSRAMTVWGFGVWHEGLALGTDGKAWMPAFAGMTVEGTGASGAGMGRFARAMACFAAGVCGKSWMPACAGMTGWSEPGLNS